MNKKTSKKPLKASKKAKKSTKKKGIDISNIPEKWPNGIQIPMYIREMMATGQISYSEEDMKAMATTNNAPPPEQDEHLVVPVVDAAVETGEEVTQSEMDSLLKEFYYSRAFKAYKRYINHRLLLVTDGMFSTDPYKEATKMAQQQGIRLGLIDVEGYIISLLNIEQNKLKENQP